MAYPWPEPTPGEWIAEMDDQRRRAAHKQRVLMYGWNERYPIGTPVLVRHHDGNGEAIIETTTTSAATMLGNTTAIVEVEGIGAVCLENVRAR